jgi:hypothetical protein
MKKMKRIIVMMNPTMRAYKNFPHFFQVVLSYEVKDSNTGRQGQTFPKIGQKTE